MKQTLCFLLLLLSCGAVVAQEPPRATVPGQEIPTNGKHKKFITVKDIPKLRIGLTVSPMFTWAKAESAQIDRGKVRGGVNYGVMVEYFFTPNYGISTGLTVMYDGGNLIYKDSLNNQVFSGVGVFKHDVPTDARYKFQYLTLPLSMKLKTNQIGYFTYFGELGFELGFAVEAKVSASQNDNIIYDEENFLKRTNNTVFSSTIVNFSLHGGGGVEYAITGRTSLVLGLFYNNGFTNVVKENSIKNITLNNVVMKVGILF